MGKRTVSAVMYKQPSELNGKSSIWEIKGLDTHAVVDASKKNIGRRPVSIISMTDRGSYFGTVLDPPTLSESSVKVFASLLLKVWRTKSHIILSWHSTAPVNGYMFGKGVYFADVSSHLDLPYWWLTNPLRDRWCPRQVFCSFREILRFTTHSVCGLLLFWVRSSSSSSSNICLMPSFLPVKAMASVFCCCVRSLQSHAMSSQTQTTMQGRPVKPLGSCEFQRVTWDNQSQNIFRFSAQRKDWEGFNP